MPECIGYPSFSVSAPLFCLVLRLLTLARYMYYAKELYMIWRETLVYTARVANRHWDTLLRSLGVPGNALQGSLLNGVNPGVCDRDTVFYLLP